MVEKLVEFSESREHTILEPAFSWLLREPAVASVIAGATSPEQAKSNAAAAQAGVQGPWRLTKADLSEIEAILSRSE